MRITGHISGIESTFPEDRPKMIGEAKGHNKGISQNARAQNRAQHDIARKAGGPGKECKATNREQMFEHIRCVDDGAAERVANPVRIPPVPGVQQSDRADGVLPRQICARYILPICLTTEAECHQRT